jgi:plasmid stabilization system protein ParE
MVVRITKTAKKNLFTVAAYLDEEWNEKVTDEFLSRFNTLCELIALQPRAFPISLSVPGMRVTRLTKHNAVYFRIYPTFISIVKILDSRTKKYKR